MLQWIDNLPPAEYLWPAAGVAIFVIVAVWTLAVGRDKKPRRPFTAADAGVTNWVHELQTDPNEPTTHLYHQQVDPT